MYSYLLVYTKISVKIRKQTTVAICFGEGVRNWVAEERDGKKTS